MNLSPPPPPIRVTSPPRHVLLDLITRITFGEEYKSQSSELFSFFSPPVTSCRQTQVSSLAPSPDLSVCFPHNVGDQVSKSYKTAEEIMVLYILILIFLNSRLEDLQRIVSG